jgi:deferrochelatase/peroxidase EfeB
VTPHAVEAGDVQGLVRFSYKRLTTGRFDLLRIRDAAAARAWLRSVTVTTAEVLPKDRQPDTAVNVAFTAAGLAALGVPAPVIVGFSHEFRTGITEPHRSRLLGDVGANAPERWQWGGTRTEPHLLVLFYAVPGRLDDAVAVTTGPDFAAAFETLASMPHRHDEREPFGFADGISQPTVDWEHTRETPATQVEYTNVVALGEFLLGYPNEYGRITDRPLLDPDERSADLPAALEAPARRDLGRNGTYLVLRQLSQDVHGFWQFVHRASDGDPAAAESLAAAMVGRTVDGDPLVPRRDAPVPGVARAQDRFTFDEDPSGSRCPLGAHVRRANPRNGDFPLRRVGLLKKIVIMLGFGPRGYRDDLISSTRFHRLLRRGRRYGPDLSRAAALQPAAPEEAERGVLFVALNANLSRQFEFVQNAWIVNGTFDGMAGEADPLLGTREPLPGCPVASDFSLQQEAGLRRRVSSLPRFITVRGGGYFFLPGVRALRYIAGPVPPPPA